MDLFFILSGWVMAHVYHDRMRRESRGALRAFYVARVARLYPLHLFTMLAWIALMPRVGVGMDWAGVRDCLPNLLTLSFVWGPMACTPLVSPSWSISAEAAVYIVFPLMVFLGLAATAPRGASLVALGLIGYAAFAASDQGIHVIAGAAPLRALCGFLIGMGLWQLGRSGHLPDGRAAARLQAAAMANIAVTLLLGMPSLLTLCACVALVASLGCGTGPVARLFTREPLLELGRLSFGVYLWHWFAIGVLVKAQLMGAPAVIVALTVAAVLLWARLPYVLLEVPARRALRGAPDEGRAGQTTPAPPVEAAGNERGRMQIVYDGDCPFCSRYVAMVRLREAAGPVELINAREAHPAVDRVRAAGYDLNQGMALVDGDEIHFGDACIHRIALMSTPSGLFNRVNAAVFRSPALSRMLYPVLRLGRNATLRMLGRAPI